MDNYWEIWLLRACTWPVLSRRKSLQRLFLQTGKGMKHGSKGSVNPKINKMQNKASASGTPDRLHHVRYHHQNPHKAWAGILMSASDVWRSARSCVFSSQALLCIVKLYFPINKSIFLTERLYAFGRKQTRWPGARQFTRQHLDRSGV